MRHLHAGLLLLALTGALAARPAIAQAASAPAAAPLPAASLFAVEIRTGPKWDPAKPPQEQAYFREHSAHLRRLREAGVLVMGARYADKGLVVISAAQPGEVKALMEQDPSMTAGTFVYEVHPFSVFYSGELKAPARK